MRDARGIRSAQKERALSFPKDRIPFYWRAAAEDQRTFMAIIERRMTLSEGCAAIARANFLDYVSEDQLINEMKICGWL